MSDKKQQWQAIKTQAPDLAVWLTEINKAFGKPAALRVELPDGQVIESGIFKGPHSRLMVGNRMRVGYG